MPSKHPVRAWVATTTTEWERFRALATIAGKSAADVLGELVAGELKRQGVQLKLDELGPAASSSPAPPAKRTSSKAKPKATRKAPSKRAGAPWAPAGSKVRPTRRRKLPIVSDALVEAEAKRGARPAKRSRPRGTIAVEGADRHGAAIAKANARSGAGGKVRPTRRRK